MTSLSVVKLQVFFNKNLKAQYYLSSLTFITAKTFDLSSNHDEACSETHNLYSVTEKRLLVLLSADKKAAAYSM